MYALLALATLLSPAPAQQRGLTFDTQLKSVAVFRDGYGYFVREGQVKLENGWATTNFLPKAIRGTVYVYALDKGDRIDQVITTKNNKVEFNNPSELKTKLADKIGLHIIVVLNNGQQFEGNLSRLLDDMLLVQAGGAYNAIPYNQIRTITIPGYPIRVKVDTANPNKTTTLGIAYLQEGIRWEPSYVMNLSGDTGELELRASMQNTTEDLNNSDVMFVVGSPFVTNRGMQDMIGNLPAPATPVSLPEGEAKDKTTAQPEKPDSALPPQMSPTVSGEEAGELFFYKKTGLSVATNDVAMVSIFQKRVPVSPSFEWNADGTEVMYLLGIKNTTQQPLTTGPVFVLEDGKALGQETIKYTPSGDVAEVRLSRGIGLRVDKGEAEVKRGGAVKIGQSMFVPITLKGTLKITNFRNSVAMVKVTKTARGKVTGQSDNGIVKNTQVLSGEVNPLNDLEWSVKVAPNETKVITYTVETFVFADRSGPPVPPTATDGDGG